MIRSAWVEWHLWRDQSGGRLVSEYLVVLGFGGLALASVSVSVSVSWCEAGMVWFGLGGNEGGSECVSV